MGRFKGWGARAVAYSEVNAANREVADDFRALLSAIPNGIMKQLLKDKERAAILAKYGITAK